MYLHALQDKGTYAIMYPYPNANYLTPLGGFSRSLLESEEVEIRKYVQSLRRYPALMAWVLALLPDSECIPAERLKRIYKIVAEEDPYHPCIIVISSNCSIMEYSGTADILMPFTQLPFLKDGGPARPLELVSQQFDLADRLKQQGEASWAYLQAYDHELLDETPTRLPNFVESRNMVYQSIIKGAKGFFGIFQCH